MLPWAIYYIYQMQTKICDCWLNVGQCKCEIINTGNERKQINSNGKINKKPRGSDDGGDRSATQPKRPFGWDARDIKTYGWIPESSRSAEGRYTNRFWEEE